MSKFDDYIARKKREYGEKFDSSDLAKQFIPYFNSGERVRVQFGYGETLFGTIGVSTGWCPVFLLMNSVRSIGSSNTLRKEDAIIAVKKKSGYRSI